MIIGINNSNQKLNIDLDHTIYFSPFQKYYNNESYSFFHNYINPLDKKYRDPSLQTTIDNNLLEEHLNNDKMKWAPLASNLIKQKLRRYLVLKYAVLNIINKYKPNVLYVGSNMDIYLNIIFDDMNSKYNLEIKYLNYVMYPHSTRLQDQVPTGIAHFVDPIWMTNLYLYFLNNNNIIFENIFEMKLTPNTYNIRNILLSSKLSYIIRKIIYNYNIVPTNIYTNNNIINKEIWASFTKDEVLFVDKVISMYYKNHSIDLINKHENIIKLLIKKIKPNKVILSTDILDYHRLIFNVANKLGIDTYNMVHGIYIDKASGIYNSNNLFLPTHQIAWNHSQMNSFKKYKWNSININYPKFKNIKKQYCSYNYYNKKNKYLILMPDWISVHEKLNEFIFINALNMFSTYFNNIKCSVDYKIKPSHLNELNKIRKTLINNVTCKNPNYQLLDYNSNTDNILKQYDMVIGGCTTGMIESICNGVPIIFYDTPINDVGIINTLEFPNVNNHDDLDYELKNYNNNSMEKTYYEFIDSILGNINLYDYV